MTYRFSFRSYRRPLRTPLRTAHGPWTERTGIIVRTEDETGRFGYGEIAPINWFGTETVEEAEDVCRKLGDRIEADVLDSIDARFGCVRFALASALAATEGEPANVRVPLTALLPAGQAARAVLRDRLEQGWLTFKWKVGVGEVDQELGLLDELLSELPAYARLRLDANGAWRRRDAARWLARCAERPIEFVEQPVEPTDASALRGLAEDFPVKLALDESVVRLEEARRWQAEGWPGLFVIKPALAGPLEDLAHWVKQSSADIVLSSAIESAVARSAILRFALNRPDLVKRSPGFGVGEVFGDRTWDGPMTGPVLDAGWVKLVNLEAVWNALS